MTEICDLCGSPDGKKQVPKPVPEFGRVGDLAIAKYPFACRCVCDNCKKIVNAYNRKLKEMRENRGKFFDEESARRKKLGLCWNCGGEIRKSGPVMVYEGCYETTRRCQHCGDTESFT